MKVDLTPLPETALITVWAKAVENGRENPICRDPWADKFVKEIDYDFDRFKKSKGSQAGVCIRTKLLDDATVHYLYEHPKTTVINLGAGLDSRGRRLAAADVIWIDIDLPEMMVLRRQLFEDMPNHHIIDGSVLDDVTYAKIPPEYLVERDILIIAEGLLMYFDEGELKSLFNLLTRRFPHARMLFEVLPQSIIGKEKYHDTLSKISVNNPEQRPKFKHGIDGPRFFEAWDPALHLVEYWSLLDYYPSRFGVFRVMAFFAALRKRFTSYILSYQFDKMDES